MTKTWSAVLALTTLFQGEGAFAAEASESPQSDWPRWRGSDFNGTSRETSVFSNDGFSLQLRWRQMLGSGYSGIAVSEGCVVTMFSNGETDFVASLSANTGSELWRYALAPTYPGREGANDGPVSTPVIAQGMVVTLGPRGDLVAIDLLTGELKWRVQLAEELGSPVPHWGFGTSPLVLGERVLVQAGAVDGMIIAFDTRNGRVDWSTGRDEVNYQSPILWTRQGRSELVASGDELLLAVDPETGREMWQYRHGGDGFYRRILNPVVVGDSSLFLTHGAGGSKLLTIEERSTLPEVREQWSTPHLKLNYATPVLHDGHVYGFSRNFLSSVNASSGALNWKSRSPGNGFPIIVDGHLVILGMGSLAARASRVSWHRSSSPRTRRSTFATTWRNNPIFRSSRTIVMCTSFIRVQQMT